MAPLHIWNDLPGSPAFKFKQLLKDTEFERNALMVSSIKDMHKDLKRIWV